MHKVSITQLYLKLIQFLNSRNLRKWRIVGHPTSQFSPTDAWPQGFNYASLGSNNFGPNHSCVDCTRTGSLLQWFPAFANDSFDKFQPPRGWGKTFIGQEGVFIHLVCGTGDFHLPWMFDWEARFKFSSHVKSLEGFDCALRTLINHQNIINPQTYLAGVGRGSSSSFSQGRAAHRTLRSVKPWEAPLGSVHSTISVCGNSRSRGCQQNSWTLHKVSVTHYVLA